MWPIRRLPAQGADCSHASPLKAGDRLAVIGALVRRDSAEDRYTAYADEYKFRAGEYLLIPVGVAAMVNHAAQPSLLKVVENTAVCLQLVRDVDANEELCFAYDDYPRARYGIA